MSVTHLHRESVDAREATRRIGEARRQAGLRARKGQLSVLIDRDVFYRWRAYCRSCQEQGWPMTAAEILEELLDRELRRKLG